MLGLTLHEDLRNGARQGRAHEAANDNNSERRTSLRFQVVRRSDGQLTAFVRTSLPQLRRCLRRAGLRDDELDDAVSETLRTVVERWHDYASPRPVGPWVLGFARNVARNVRKRRRLLALIESDPEPEARLHRSLGPAPSPYVAWRLRLAIDELPPEQRAVLLAMVVEGASAPELAEEHGVSENTVYDRLRRARGRLRRDLAREDPLDVAIDVEATARIRK